MNRGAIFQNRSSEPDVACKPSAKAHRDVLCATSRWDCPWRSGGTAAVVWLAPEELERVED